SGAPSCLNMPRYWPSLLDTGPVSSPPAFSTCGRERQKADGPVRVTNRLALPLADKWHFQQSFVHVTGGPFAGRTSDRASNEPWRDWLPPAPRDLQPATARPVD